MFTADEQKTIYNVFQSLKCEGIEWPCPLPDGGGSSNTGSSNTESSNTGSSNTGSSNPGSSNSAAIAQIPSILLFVLMFFAFIKK